MELWSDEEETELWQFFSQEEQLKVQLTQFALKKLDLIVDEFWAEISDSIQTIEVFKELLLDTGVQLSPGGV